MLQIISLYWNVFVLWYTVSVQATGWKLQWSFAFLSSKQFHYDWIGPTFL